MLPILQYQSVFAELLILSVPCAAIAPAHVGLPLSNLLKSQTGIGKQIQVLASDVGDVNATNVPEKK
jgi:hypothetical protein